MNGITLKKGVAFGYFGRESSFCHAASHFVKITEAERESVQKIRPVDRHGNLTSLSSYRELGVQLAGRFLP